MEEDSESGTPSSQSLLRTPLYQEVYQYGDDDLRATPICNGMLATWGGQCYCGDSLPPDLSLADCKAVAPKYKGAWKEEDYEEYKFKNRVFWTK